jgi:hypothetical protein
MSIRTKLPIQASLLVSTNLTLKDMKLEMLLSFVGYLFDEYKRYKDDDFQENPTITITSEPNNDDFIEKMIEELSGYFEENVLSQERLFQIFRDGRLDYEHLLLAKQYEPLGVYYEKLSILLRNGIPDGGLFMPEYLGLLLLHYYFQKIEYSFGRFSFLSQYDFQYVLEIYNDVNITLKKELVEKNPNTRIWEHRTVFDRMEKIAQKMVDEYFTFHYKLNVKRVSKTRRKK